MKKLRFIPLKFQLVLIILSITLFITGTGFYIGLHQYEKSLKNDLMNNLEVYAGQFGESCVSYLALNDSSAARQMIGTLRKVPALLQACLYDENHHLFAFYKRQEAFFQSPFPEDTRIFRIRIEDPVIHMIVPVAYENRRYGQLYLAATLDPLHEKIKAAGSFMIGLFLVLVALGTGLAFLMQRIISGPILKLAGVMEQISNEADLSLRINRKRPDELGLLYDGFNTMLEQLHLRQMEWIQAEEEIRSALREKEVMLREIHHRVKNNLQIVSSLLSLQSTHIHDNEALSMFADCQNRVRAMALVHEKLYQAPDLASIRFSDYVDALIMGLQSTYRTDCTNIRFDVDILDIDLTVDKAVPCGLLIHELVSNSMKHAFDASKEGLIQIRLRRDESDGRLYLEVRDNGRGIPENIDFRNTASLGLRLALVLTENQLRGSIDLDRTSGTAFSIVF